MKSFVSIPESTRQPTGDRPGPGTVTQERQKWHALLAAWLGEAFDAMDATMFFIVMYPALADLLHSNDPTAIGWHCALVSATFTFGWGLGSIIFGYLSDRIGRVKTMSATILLYAVASGLCAFSSHWWDLAIYRFLVGLGIGGECSIGSVLLSEFWQDARKQHWAISVMKTSFPVGVILTGIFNLGSGQFGWRYLFVIGVIPAIVTFYIRVTMRDSQKFSEIKRLKEELKRNNAKLLSTEEQSLVGNPLKAIFARQYRWSTILASTMIASATIGYWGGVSWMSAWINQLTGAEAVGERSASAIFLSIGSLLGGFMTPLLLRKFGYSGALKIGFLWSFLLPFSMFVLVHSYQPLAINTWAFGIGFAICIPWVIMCSYLPLIFPTHLLGTGSGFSWSVGRILTAFFALGTGPVLAMFHGSYAAAAATATLTYLIGFIAAFKVREVAN
jgi:MFS family permease